MPEVITQESVLRQIFSDFANMKSVTFSILDTECAVRDDQHRADINATLASIHPDLAARISLLIAANETDAALETVRAALSELRAADRYLFDGDPGKREVFRLVRAVGDRSDDRAFWDTEALDVRGRRYTAYDLRHRLAASGRANACYPSPDASTEWPLANFATGTVKAHSPSSIAAENLDRARQAHADSDERALPEMRGRR